MGKKKRRGFFDDFFERFFGDFDIEFPMESEVSGYSIEVRTTPEGTEVRAKVHGNVDVEKFRKQLENMYPGAKIIIETPEGVYGSEEEKESFIRIEKRETIKEVEEEKQPEPPRGGIRITFRDGKPIIFRDNKSSELMRIEKKETISEDKLDESQKEGKAVRITFKNGKPVIKKIE